MLAPLFTLAAARRMQEYLHHGQAARATKNAWARRPCYDRSMSSFVWLNGEFVDESQASVPIRDAGLLHAAGVFTTMRSAGGRIFRIAEHLKRLRESCEALFIPLQHKDDVLAAATTELLDRNDLA